MRILVLGGTSFVGRAIVADALGAGLGVTLFGRGRTGTDLFPKTPRRIGDRDTGDYTALTDAAGHWDAVVDVRGRLIPLGRFAVPFPTCVAISSTDRHT